MGAQSWRCLQVLELNVVRPPSVCHWRHCTPPSRPLQGLGAAGSGRPPTAAVGRPQPRAARRRARRRRGGACAWRGPRQQRARQLAVPRRGVGVVSRQRGGTWRRRPLSAAGPRCYLDVWLPGVYHTTWGCVTKCLGCVQVSLWCAMPRQLVLHEVPNLALAQAPAQRQHRRQPARALGAARGPRCAIDVQTCLFQTQARQVREGWVTSQRVANRSGHAVRAARAQACGRRNDRTLTRACHKLPNVRQSPAAKTA